MGLARSQIVRGSGGDQPTIDVPFGKKLTEATEFPEVQAFVNNGMDRGKETRETRRVDPLHGPFECGRSRKAKPKGQKHPGKRLKLMNPPPQKGSTCLEKNETATKCAGPHKMANSRMIERLGTANPHDRRGTGDDGAHSFMRNGMSGTEMQDLGGIREFN